MAVYLTNYDYISDELRSELKARYHIANESQNLKKYLNLIDYVSNYNQKTISFNYIKGELDYTNLIDLSMLCFDDYDKRVNNLLFKEWFNAYDLSEKSIKANSNFHNLFKYVTSFDEMSNGAKFQAKLTIVPNLMHLTTNYVLNNYEGDELARIFDENYLVAQELRFKEGATADESIDPELMYLASIYDTLQKDYVSSNEFADNVISTERAFYMNMMNEVGKQHVKSKN